MPESEVRVWYQVGTAHVFEATSNYDVLCEIRYKLRRLGIRFREQTRRLR